MEKVRIVLERAPDDLNVSDPKFQEELAKFSTSLRGAEVTYSQSMFVRDAVHGGGYSLAEFVVTLGPVITVVAGLIGVWLHARYGRKVRIKIGEVEAEAQTVNEVEKLLRRAQEFQEQSSTDNKHRSR